MAKRKRTITENSIRKRLKEGRGTGRLSEYRPWLHIQDVPSLGLSSRIKGWKTQRVHHFLSGLELLYFYILEWSINVIDIREQYPLLPSEETIAIARSCGIRHPVHPRTKYPIVMTTDFVNTVRYGRSSADEPRTVKYKADLLNQRTLEKLEIERRYWAARRKTLKIITEDSISKPVAKNVEWFHSCLQLQNLYGLDPLTLSLLCSIVVNALKEQTAPLRDITIRLDDHLGLEPGTCLLIVRHLLANRYLHVDMRKLINPSKPLDLID
jgi:hypothetical protein